MLVRQRQEVQEVPRGVIATGAPGVELSGLEKTYKTPRGAIHAVRGIDVTIPAGETVAPRPERRGKSTTIDILLGLSRPTQLDPYLRHLAAEAIARGAVGAMLQTGGLIRDLTVRADRDDRVATRRRSAWTDARAHRHRRHRRPTDPKALGRPDAARAFRNRDRDNADLLVLDEPTVAMDVESRKAFWETMRNSPRKAERRVRHALPREADAYADRAVLMARGRVVADGPTTEIKGMVGTRTIRATLPGADLDRLAALPGVTRVGRAVRPSSLAPTRTPPSGRSLPRSPGRTTSRSPAPASEAFLALTGGERRDEERAHEFPVMQLRAVAHVPEPAFSPLLARHSDRPIPGHRRPEPQRERPGRKRDLGAALPDGRPRRVRLDERHARHAAHGSPPSARRAGTASCASRRSSRARTSARKSSRVTSRQARRSCCSMPRASLWASACPPEAGCA